MCDLNGAARASVNFRIALLSIYPRATRSDFPRDGDDKVIPPGIRVACKCKDTACKNIIFPSNFKIFQYPMI